MNDDVANLFVRSIFGGARCALLDDVDDVASIALCLHSTNDNNIITINESLKTHNVDGSDQTSNHKEQRYKVGSALRS